MKAYSADAKRESQIFRQVLEQGCSGICHFRMLQKQLPPPQETLAPMCWFIGRLESSGIAGHLGDSPCRVVSI